MKVLLIHDIDSLGLAGEIKDVADGYGRNYLIPKGLAVLATPGALKDADLHRRRAAEQRQREADEMAALAEAVGKTRLVFQAKAGEKGRLYGSITTADIADQLGEAVGREIDRRKLSFEGPIKQLGTHQVTLRLSADAVADFAVVVEPIDGPEATVEPAQEAEKTEEPAAAAKASEIEEATTEE